MRSVPEVRALTMPVPIRSLVRFCRRNSRRGEPLTTFRVGAFAGSRRLYHELGYESTGPIVADVLRHRSSPDSVPPELSGDANAALVGRGTSLVSASDRTVRVKMLYAPWNPADMNTVQGYYPTSSAEEMQRLRRSRYHEGTVVAGSEGIGQVVSCSTDPPDRSRDGASSESQSSLLSPGDYVTLAVPSLGTFRSDLTVPESFLLKLERGHELIQALEGSAASASCLFQMGGTALRMLSDFVPALPGLASAGSEHQHPPQPTPPSSAATDAVVVVQNAGNSAVGFMVSQIAAIHDVPVVSLVRRGARDDGQLLALVRHLEGAGRSRMVVVEEDLQQDRASGLLALKDRLRDLSPTQSLPQLALNAVGGSSCGLLLKVLGPGGTMVTYGGMSRKPVTVSTAQLIFDDIRVRGYWQSRWMSEQPRSSKLLMVNQLVDLVLDRGLRCPPVRVFKLKDYQQALEFEADQSVQAVRSKVVFDCQ